MIARITFKLFGDPAEAVLDDDRTWHAPEPMGGVLNSILATEDDSPSRGYWLRAHAAAMAEMLGGTVEFGPDPESVPGRVY